MGRADCAPDITEKRGTIGKSASDYRACQGPLGLGAVLILVLLPLRKLRYTGDEVIVSRLGSI